MPSDKLQLIKNSKMRYALNDNISYKDNINAYATVERQETTHEKKTHEPKKCVMKYKKKEKKEKISYI